MDKKKNRTTSKTSTQSQPNYDFWLQQSKMFYENLNALQDFFKHDYSNPNLHQEQINLWLDALKKQAQSLNKEQAQTEWQMMNRIMLKAADLMVTTWLNRAKEDNPVKSTQELYQLWLNNCQDMYQKSWAETNAPDAYKQWINMFNVNG